MNDPNLAITLRGKMLGVLMRDARVARGQSVEACAGAMAREASDYEAFEAGQDSPSLPELELLAYSLDVSVKHFLGDQTLDSERTRLPTHRPVPAAQVAELRDRIIGLQLRQARLAAGLPADALADAVGVTAEWVEAAEAGRQSIPLPVLERAAARLGVGLDNFAEGSGPVGEWDSLERAAERVRQLPPELRDFVSRPANEPYLWLAHQLSRLTNERLRGVAESLLDITY
jgi:transcriptional regulator with XRE-family HTH domain